MYDVSTIEPGTLINVVFDTAVWQPLKRVRARGSIDYVMASDMRDVMTDHKNIYSTLTQQPVDNIRAAKFLVIEDANGKRVPIADLWIRSVSIITGLDVDFSVSLDNRQELELLTKALAGQGINDVKYTIRERT
jgi:hypothetical protein